MPNRQLPSKERLLKVFLMRVGKEVEIQRADGSATENEYGKVPDSDVTRTSVATERARRLYETNDERPMREPVTGGRNPDDAPRLAFHNDANVQQGDHVVFPNGTTYHVLESQPRDSHTEWTVEEVN